MKARFALLFVAGLALLFSACSKDNDPATDLMNLDEKSAQTAAALCESCTYTDELTEADIAGLLFMREEEKLAHDVYSAFFATYQAVVFNNIAGSEQTHMDAMLNLINGYNLTDPVIVGEGNFANTDLAALYSALLAKGSDLEAALAVGAEIEEIDILDLQAEIARTESDDLKRVYGNLLSGSESHLLAFVKVLARLGVDYQPQQLSSEYFAEILAGTNGNGGKGKGKNGKGTGNGSGTATQNGSNGTNGTGVCDGTQSGTNTATQNGGNTGSGNSNGKGK